jgi:magnesium transporter
MHEENGTLRFSLMALEPVTFAFLSEILGTPIVSTQTGKRIGRVADLAASAGQVYPKVTGILIRAGRRTVPYYLPWSQVHRSDYARQILVDHNPDAPGSHRASEGEFLLRKSFLDRQLISTSGYKLVRVNDLQLLIDNSPKGAANLFLVHIDVGVKGLLRRLGWLRPVNAVIRWIVARDMRDLFLSWKHIQPTTTTTVQGSLRLTTDASKLSELHPADLADILEDLGTDERKSLFESLDPATAASTMQEMPLNVRVQVAETLETAKLAAIIQAMQRDESVDLMEALGTECRNAVYRAMPPETASEIRELANLSTFGVGSILNTEFIAVPPSLTVAEVLERIRAEARHVELIYYVYIVDAQERLHGIASLRSILTADPTTPLTELMHEKFVTASIDDRIKEVAQIFLKYNFEAIPVLGDDQRLLGIISLRDTLEAVFPGLREDTKV